MKHLITICLTLLLFGSCRPIKKFSETTKSDSTWLVQRPLSIKMTGGTTSPIDLDSVKKLLSLLPKNNKTTTHYVNVPDSSGKALLRFWMGVSGQMYADCTAKDQMYQTTLNEKNRIIKNLQSTKEVKEVTPAWCWWLVAGNIIAIVIILVLKFR